MSTIIWRSIDQDESRVLREGRDEDGNVYYTYEYKNDPGKKRIFSVLTEDGRSGRGASPGEALADALESVKS